MSYEAKSKYLFIWKIKNYSSYSKKNKKFLASSLFLTENIGDSLWRMHLYPKGRNTDPEDYASVFIKRLPYDIRADVNYIDIIIEIVSPDGSILTKVEKENVSMKRGQAFGSKYFFSVNAMTLEMAKWKEDTLVVHCTLVNRKQLICESQTTINVDGCTFKWNVAFPSGSNSIPPTEKEFCLSGKFKFDVNLTAPVEDIKLSISKRDNEISVPELTCRISLLDVSESEVKSKRASHVFKEENDSVWEFPTFISVKYLKDNRRSLLQNGIFTLLFEFYSPKEKDPVNVIYPICNSLKENNNIISLRRNLQQMYRSELHADIELQVDGKLFKTHKSVLAARSPVFKAMFEQDVVESQTGVVTILDVDADVFGLFLEFLYTATVENMEYETAIKLIILADKYQIISLRFDCCQVLRSHLSVENACEVVNIADMISYESLKAFVVDYIANHAREILTSSEWMKWSEQNVKLASEVMSMIAMNF